jgi:asparagine synthase (glutamine-hydrolysing)
VGGGGGDQPLKSKCGRLVVVFNGEVFNYKELGLGESSTSDVAFLADKLLEHGPSYLSRLRGPFALAALDVRDHTLLLARDERSIRPLYFAVSPTGIKVASEVAPLLSQNSTLDTLAWDHLLAFQFWPPDRTPFLGVTPLSAGSWRRYALKGSLKLEAQGTVRFRSEATLDAASALADAFALQAPVQGKAAATLSGGLDSSAVVGSLKDAGKTVDFAAVGWFEGASSRFDERPFARAVAKELAIPLLEVPISKEAFVAAWPKLISALGGPVGGPGGPAQWLVSEAIAAQGASVVYSGQGGDELFGGYERYRLLQQWDAGQPMTPSEGYEGLLSGFSGDPARQFLFRGRELLPWLQEERRRGVLNAARALPSPHSKLAEAVPSFEREIILPGLLSIEDRTHSAFGMEGRVPLLDPLLARAAEAVPFAIKSPAHAPRSWFKQLLGTRLPQAAAARKDKMGFPVPIQDWFKGPLSSATMDELKLDRLVELGFLPSVREALRRGDLPARTVYFLASAGLCLDQFVGLQAWEASA